MLNISTPPLPTSLSATYLKMHFPSGTIFHVYIYMSK